MDAQPLDDCKTTLENTKWADIRKIVEQGSVEYYREVQDMGDCYHITIDAEELIDC